MSEPVFYLAVCRDFFTDSFELEHYLFDEEPTEDEVIAKFCEEYSDYRPPDLKRTAIIEIIKISPCSPKRREP